MLNDWPQIKVALDDVGNPGDDDEWGQVDPQSISVLIDRVRSAQSSSVLYLRPSRLMAVMEKGDIIDFFFRCAVRDSLLSQFQFHRRRPLSTPSRFYCHRETANAKLINQY